MVLGPAIGFGLLEPGAGLPPFEGEFRPKIALLGLFFGAEVELVPEPEAEAEAEAEAGEDVVAHAAVMD
jgi:hypothetical protein